MPAPNEEQKFFSKLYSKLAESFAVEGKNPVPEANYLALANPGIPLEEKPKPGPEFEAAWAQVLDQAPALNWSYTPNGNLVSKVYGDTLEYHELAEVTLTEGQKKQLEAAKAVLYVEEEKRRKKTPLYNEYTEYQNLYLKALTDLENAIADAHNTGTKVPRKFIQALTAAREEWVSLGGKVEIETAVATVRNLSQLDPQTWWGRLETLYDTAKDEFGQGELLPSSTFPSYDSVVGADGWAEFTFTNEDMEKQESSKVVEGGASANYGLFSIGGSYDSKHEAMSTNMSGLKLSMKVKRALILRPWMDTTVFSAHSWRWPAGHDGGVISYGGPQAGEPPLMPLLPTGILVVRDVNIQIQFSHEDMDRFESHLQAGASIGWGPFSLSGSYNEAKKEVTTHATLDSNGITIQNPQILGFFCNALPLCPSPNPALPWPAPKSDQE